MAFTLGTSRIELLDDTGTSVDEVAVPLKVAPEIMWTFRNVEEQVNAKGRLSIAMEVRNDGNAVDGLIVQLQSSHAVDMGFIPPGIAVYEEGIEFPRSFEINDIPLNSNFTIRAWAQLPQDQTSNGTVYINTTIRSRFAPELPFVHTSTGTTLAFNGNPSQRKMPALIGRVWRILPFSMFKPGGAWLRAFSSLASSSTKRSLTENDDLNKATRCPTKRRSTQPRLVEQLPSRVISSRRTSTR